MSFRSALEALSAAQKPNRGTPAYSRLVNRPAARYVAAAGSTRGMTPNQATAISAALSGTAIVAIAVLPPRWWTGLVIGLLLMAGYLMDSVDGQLARLSGRGSLAGEWLDHTIDCTKTVALHLAVAIAWFRFPPLDSDLVLLIPLGYAVVASVSFFGLIIVPTLRARVAAPKGDADAPGAEPWWRMYAILPTDYGFLCVVFLTFGSTRLFGCLYAAIFLLNSLVLALALRKWWRELCALDRTSAQAR